MNRDEIVEIYEVAVLILMVRNTQKFIFPLQI